MFAKQDSFVEYSLDSSSFPKLQDREAEEAISDSAPAPRRFLLSDGLAGVGRIGNQCGMRAWSCI